MLAPEELVALVLGSGGRAGSVFELAPRLLGALGGPQGLARAEVADIARHPGVGPAGAARLVAAVELGRRALVPGFDARLPLTGSAQVAERFGPLLAGRDQETFHVVALDARNRPLRALCVAEGTLTACPVHPRDVFRPAVRAAAVAVVLVHNHPSGDPTPSAEDVALTARLVEAGEVVGIRVLDHVVVGAGGFRSLADMGLLGGIAAVDRTSMTSGVQRR